MKANVETMIMPWIGFRANLFSYFRKLNKELRNAFVEVGGEVFLHVFVAKGGHIHTHAHVKLIDLKHISVISDVWRCLGIRFQPFDQRGNDPFVYIIWFRGKSMKVTFHR